jgi:type I protein arginine methyltransferase
MDDYTHSDHLHMMADGARMAAYRAAIQQVVRPGDTVLDLGAGSGIMTFQALRAGAAHVYAIDPSHNVDVLTRVARANNLWERITIMQGDSRTTELPDRIDVVIADLRGPMPFCGDALHVLEDARTRLLKPGGRMIPFVDHLFFAPVASPKEHFAVEGWRSDAYDADYSSIAALAANDWRKAYFGPETILSDGRVSGTLRYDDLARHDWIWSGDLVVTKPGRCTGIGGWVDAELAPEVILSSAPDQPDTVYGRAFFPLEHARPVAPGDRIHLQLELRGASAEPVWLWSLRHTRSDGSNEQERHCSLDTMPLNVASLRKRAEHFVPALNTEGQAMRLVLGMMDDGQPLRSIEADAMGFVGNQSASYSS